MKRLIILFLGAVLIFYPQAGLGQVYDPSIPPDVIRDFESLIGQLRRNPNDVPALNSVGIIYARVGQLNEAIDVWKRGLEINPKYVHLYNNLGSALKSSKKYDEARKVFQRGLELAPSYWIYYNLGLLEREVGRLSVAKTHYQACLKMNSQFEPAWRQIQEIDDSLASSGKSPFRQGPHSPGTWENKDPVDYFQAFGLPAPWEIPNESAQCESRPGAFPPGVTRQIPESPSIGIDECVAVISKIPAQPQEKVVALTFDDGPHADLTPRLLNFLRFQGAVATFFVIGSRAEIYPDIITAISAGGNEVANHTWSHKSLVNQGESAALSALKHTSELVSALTGKSCKLVRPPFGHTNSRVRSLISSQGWNQIMWDVDTRDWQDGNSTRILGRILRHFSPGSVILFHDIHPGALRALPTLVAALKKCGYRFVTVSQLMGLVTPAS